MSEDVPFTPSPKREPRSDPAELEFALDNETVIVRMEDEEDLNESNELSPGDKDTCDVEGFYNASPAPFWTFKDQFAQLYELDDDPERKEFLDKYFQFMAEKGSPVTRLPIMAKQVLDLYKLYKLVLESGGIVEVMRNKRWSRITKGLELPNTITSAAFTLRSQYVKYLYCYECSMHDFSKPQELQKLVLTNRRDRACNIDVGVGAGPGMCPPGMDPSRIDLGYAEDQRSPSAGRSGPGGDTWRTDSPRSTCSRPSMTVTPLSVSRAMMADTAYLRHLSDASGGLDPNMLASSSEHLRSEVHRPPIVTLPHNPPHRGAPSSENSPLLRTSSDDSEGCAARSGGFNCNGYPPNSSAQKARPPQGSSNQVCDSRYRSSPSPGRCDKLGMDDYHVLPPSAFSSRRNQVMDMLERPAVKRQAPCSKQHCSSDHPSHSSSFMENGCGEKVASRSSPQEEPRPFSLSVKPVPVGTKQGLQVSIEYGGVMYEGYLFARFDDGR